MWNTQQSSNGVSGQQVHWVRCSFVKTRLARTEWIARNNAYCVRHRQSLRCRTSSFLVRRVRSGKPMKEVLRKMQLPYVCGDILMIKAIVHGKYDTCSSRELDQTVLEITATRSDVAMPRNEINMRQHEPFGRCIFHISASTFYGCTNARINAADSCLGL